MKQLPSLNGLRAISVLLVLRSHLIPYEADFFNFSKIKLFQPFTYLIKDGQLGVNIFFILSGFLITLVLLNEEKNNKSISLKRFYVKRVLRIFPAYYFLLIIYSILQFIGYLNITHWQWVSAITFTKYFDPNLDWYTGHLWSLSAEEHFYILWPLIFIIGNKFRKVVAIILIIIVLCLRTYLYPYQLDWTYELNLFMRMDSIAIGCLFALYKDEILQKISPFWNKIFLFSLVSLIFLRYLVSIAKKINIDFIFIPFGSSHGTIASVLVALIMMYSVYGPKGIWYRILNLKVVNFIGIMSYSIYLWQQLFLDRTKDWAMHFPQNIFFILLVATCSYYLIERPFLRLKSKL